MLEGMERSTRASQGGQSYLTPGGGFFHGGTPTNPLFANIIGSGGAQPNASPQRHQFQAQLAQLAEMGFTNEQLCLHALTQVNGHVEQAISLIIAAGDGSI